MDILSSFQITIIMGIIYHNTSHHLHHDWRWQNSHIIGSGIGVSLKNEHIHRHMDNVCIPIGARALWYFIHTWLRCAVWRHSLQVIWYALILYCRDNERYLRLNNDILRKNNNNTVIVWCIASWSWVHERRAVATTKQLINIYVLAHQHHYSSWPAKQNLMLFKTYIQHSSRKRQCTMLACGTERLALPRHITRVVSVYIACMNIIYIYSYSSLCIDRRLYPNINGKRATAERLAHVGKKAFLFYVTIYIVIIIATYT